MGLSTFHLSCVIERHRMELTDSRWRVFMLGGIVIFLMASSVKSTSCYVCPTMSIPFLCAPTDCGIGASCFTQAWLEYGLTYYQRGCLTPSVLGDCDTISSYFCTSTNAFHCCTGDNCNGIDPLKNWVSRKPSNLKTFVRETSIEITWDPTCIGDYRYDVEYAKVVAGTTAGQYHSTVSTYSNSIDIHSLNPATSYLFRVRAYNGGAYSDAEITVTSTLSPAPAGPSSPITLYGAKCWKTDRYFGAPNYLHTCSNSDDWCFSQAEYLANTSERLTSRGCMSDDECQNHMELNLENCEPGNIGAVCNFCCRGEHCNTVEWTYSGLTCDKIPVQERILCGWSGISISDCFQRGCCYLPSNDTVAWCHHGKYPTNTTPPPIAQGQILTSWMIVLIVLLILLLIIIIAVVVRCCLKRKRKSQRGSYDVYAIPKPRRDRIQNVTTVSRESYDNMVISE